MFLVVAMAIKLMCNDSVSINLCVESAHFGQEGDILLPLTLPVVMYESLSYKLQWRNEIL